MRAPRSTIICSSATPRSRACCRAACCAPPPPRIRAMFPDRPARTWSHVAARIALAALLAVPALSHAADYVQQPGSTLVFASTYEGEAFTGRFPGFVTRFNFDPAQLTAARLDVTIPLATAATGNSDYDGEIRGSGFFDAAKFPQAR